MLKEAIGTGKTIELAVEDARKMLGLENTDEATIEVLEQPKTGFFRRSPAKVRVFIENTKADLAVSILKNILENIGVNWEVDINVIEKEDSVTIKMDGDKLGFIIGYRGETLDSLQYIVGLMTNQIDGEYYRVTLDCGNYREKREKTLENLAERLSKKVARTGYSSKLEAMNPYERRIIHSIVQTQKDVISESIGEDPYRSVVIKSTNPSVVKNRRRPNNRTDSKNRSRGPNKSQHRSKARPVSKKTQEIKPTEGKPKTVSEAVIGDLYGKINL